MPNLSRILGATVAATAVSSVLMTAAPAFAATKPARTATKSVTTTTTTTTTQTAAPTATVLTAPSGQTTVAGVLSSTASTFSTGLSGWTSYAGGAVAPISSIGHTALGALSVTSAGGWTGATSPAFAVTPNARYSASAFGLAKAAGHSVGLALQFRDATGALISSASQVGQGLTDRTTAWTQTATAVGFAPSNAVTGVVLALDFDGAAGDVQYFDDVNVQRTTGVAAPIVGPLRTSGKHVLDGQGRVVHFHGVDIDGLQYSNTANVSTSEVSVAQTWGANYVRLPLSENYVVPSDCSYDATYLSKVDALVNAATSAGMFIMLDLHTNAMVACASPRQQQMPDINAVTFWQIVASRYAANPLVGFDLYNEPHDVSDSVWRNGGSAVAAGGGTYTAVGMQQLYNTVRATGATNLVFASGNNWANTFPAAAPLTGTSNLIYAVHAYTCPTGLPSSGASCNNGPDGTIYDPSGILRNFASIGTTMPVMVTEFGFPSAYDGRYITNVASYAAAQDWVGWDVYAFDNTSAGLFDLWKNSTGVIEPSVSGMAVMTGMLTD